MAERLRTWDLAKRMRRPTVARVRAEDPAVSAASVWSADVWRLDVRGADCSVVVIDFGVVPEPYRDVGKMSVWMSISGAAGRARSAKTVITTAAMRYLYDFLGRVAPAGLDAVTQAHLLLFRDVFRASLAREYPDGFSDGVPWRVVSPLTALWEQRAEMAEAGLEPLRFDPFEGTTPAAFVASLGGAEQEAWPPLPIEVSRLVQPHAERVLGRIDCVQRLQRRVLRLIEREGGQAGRETLACVWSWTYEDDEGRTFHSVPDTVRTPNQAVLHVDALLRVVEGAAAWLVWHETAMRQSEFGSLIAGRDAATGLPGCIEVVPLPDDGLELFLLHGTVFKHLPEPRPGVWVLASRMLGANRMPPAVAALDALERIHAPWRGGAGSLLVRWKLRGGPARRSGGRPPVMNDVVLAMREFLATEVPWSALTSAEPLTAAIVASHGAVIVPSHMRKGLVNWCVRLDTALVGPVGVQLQHGDEVVTDVDYAGNDPTLLEPAREYASLELARVMLAMSGGDRGGGGLPPTHSTRLVEVAAIRRDLNAELWLPTAARLVRDAGLAPAREPIGSLVPRDPAAASTERLLQRYRSSRRVYLEGCAAGWPEEFASLARQAEAIGRQLATLGIDPPSDGELA